MKLQNKKTGGLANIDELCVHTDAGWHDYSSLAELNEEWEDYEEPKEQKKYWFINSGGGTLSYYEEDEEPEDTEACKEIGNYFDTQEEAEKAVEKLKAWKLLKDECDIKFDGIIRDDEARLKAVKLSYDRHPVTFTRMRECMDALHLLFGGEE